MCLCGLQTTVVVERQVAEGVVVVVVIVVGIVVVGAAGLKEWRPAGAVGVSHRDCVAEAR